jgi:Xaa-Pro aminopeptidase
VNRLAPSSVDRAVKRARLVEVLDRHGADRLVLRSPGALSWYLDGARVHVSLAGDPVLAVVVGRDRDEWLAFGNEAERLVAEELPHDDAATLTRVPWFEPLDAAVGPRAGALAEADVAIELRGARASLLPTELDRYRALCRESAEVLTDVAGAVSPTDSEQHAAALLAAGLVDRGIDPLVVLVSGRERVAHRHPLPTAAALGRRAMLVVCGRRAGLIANVTRWVSFGAVPAGEADADRRILDVEAAFFAATVPGAALAEAWRSGVAAYGAAGFAADEWRNHHQGGAAGYVGRDPRGTADVADSVHEVQAFAWNPSAPGAKVEDTVLVRAGAAVEVLTRDERWPTVDVAGVARPVVWER